jgi:uncharacterized protein (DUF362 family)
MPDDISRRRLLKGSAVGLAVAVGCSSTGSDTGSTVAPPGSGGSGGTGGSGTGGKSGSGGGSGKGGGGGGAGGKDGGPEAGVDAGADADASMDADAAEDADAGEDLSIPEGKGVVGIVHRDDVESAVRRAVALAGGVDFIQPGESVFVKVNAVWNLSPDRPAIRTNADVVAAVVRIVKERNPSKITVGDRAARFFSTADSMNLGIAEAALKAGADEIFNAQTPAETPEEWILAKPPGSEAIWPEGILVMKRLVEADHVINVPTCKNHFSAGYSLGMKLMIGAIGDSSRNLLHVTAENPEDVAPSIAILNGAFKVELTVLDAWDALLNDGPFGDPAKGVWVPTRLVMASRNRVALDAAGVSLLKLELETAVIPMPDTSQPYLQTHKVWDLAQLKEAIARGFGVTKPEDVILRFDGVDNADALEAVLRAV